MKEAKVTMKLPSRVMAYYELLSVMPGVPIADVLAVAVASQALRMSPIGAKPKKRKRANV